MRAGSRAGASVGSGYFIPAALAVRTRAVHLPASGRPRLRIVVDALVRLAIMVVGMLIEHRREQLWQAELRRRAELARSGTHWRQLDEAARGLDHPALQARLEAVEALRDVAGDFPVLRAEIRGLLAAQLRERGAAYRDRTLPPDLREMRRFLHEPEEDVVGSWTPF